MFSKATAKFVHQVDPEGSLIHVSRVNDSHKSLPMAIVIKHKRTWAWQRPKYQPTDFTSGDSLQGDEVLRPGVSETEFSTYNGTYRDERSGKSDAEAGPINVSLEGSGSSKSETCFGKSKKEESDVKKSLKDSSLRLMDMQHILVQQSEKDTEVLTVVKERILTTNSCSVTSTKKQQCIFQGVSGLSGSSGNSLKVCGKDINNIESDSDVSSEIPSGTVLAYSVSESEIKKNGHYAICLQPGTIGGFESDAIPFHDTLDMVDGRCKGHRAWDDMPFTVFQNGWQKMDLSPSADLPQVTQCGLMEKLQEALKDRPASSCLQNASEKIYNCEREQTPVIDGNSTILDSMESCCFSEDASTFHSYPDAVYLSVSAMEESPDETSNILSNSRPDFSEAFDALICRLKESSGTSSILSLPTPSQDNQVFQQAEQSLSSVCVTLRRDAEQLRMEMTNTGGVLPSLLGLSVHGSALLSTGSR